MPSTRFDVLNAVDTLSSRRESATTDAVVSELLTIRADVAPQLIDARRAWLLVAAKLPDGQTEFELTDEGRAALMDQLQ